MNPYLLLGREDRRAKFLESVDRLATKHGMTRKALLSMLTDNTPDGGWRALFQWSEFHEFTLEEVEGDQ